MTWASPILGRHLMRTTAARVAAFALLAATVVAQQAVVTRAYSLDWVSKLGRAVDEDLLLEVGPLRLRSDDAAAALGEDKDTFRLDSPATVRFLDALRMVYTAAGLDPDHIPENVASVDGEVVRLTVDDAHHAAVARALADLTSAIRDAYRMDVFEIAGGDELPAGAVLTSAAARKLMVPGKSRHIAGTNLRPGISTSLRSTGTRAYLQVVAAEVACASRPTGDPTVGTLERGIRAVARVLDAGGGRIAVSFRGAVQREATPPRLHDVNFTSRGTIQLPVVDWTCLGAESVVESGGAIVLAADGPAPVRWLVSVRSGKRTDPDADSPFIPVGVLRFDGGHAQVELPPGRLAPSGSSDYLDVTGPAPDEADPILGSILQSTPQTTLLGTSLVMHGDVGARRSVRTQIESATRDRTKSATVEFRAGEIDGVAGAAAGGGGSADAAQTAPFVFRVPIVTGHRVRLIAATAHAYLKDQDIEIAHDTSVGNAVVAVVDDGTDVSVEAHAVGQGTWLVQWELGRGRLAVPIPGVPSTREEIGNIEMPTTTTVTASGTSLVKAGDWVELNRTSGPGSARPFVAFLRLTE